MGWDDNTLHNVLTKPISLGDISFATGVGGPPYDLGNMIANGTAINPMAKYKPVKSSNPGILTDTERKNTRYGFGGITSKQLNLDSNPPVLTNDWVYEKPTAGQPNEWFRALDFDGYARLACAPLVVSVGQLVYEYNKESQLLLWANDKSNAMRTDGRRWVANQSLSIEELLNGAEEYYEQYIGFVLHNTNSNHGGLNFISTYKTFKQFIQNDYGNTYFTLYGAGGSGSHSGRTCPGVPVLSSTNVGDTFEIIVCLSTRTIQAGYEYEVFTSSMGSPYSLGFVAGCDRTTAELRSGADTWDGTQITYFNISTTLISSDYSYDGQLWNGYAMTADAKFDTTGAPYGSGTSVTISGSLNITNSGSFRIGSNPGSGESVLSVPVATTVYGATTDQYARTLFSSVSDPTKLLWVLKNGGTPISTTVYATVTITYPLNAPISASDDVSIP